MSLRPEQITHKVDSELSKPHTNVANRRVEFVEPTGPDTLVLVTLNGKEVVCRVHPPEARGPGEAMDLMFDVGKVVFFDPATEKRVG